MLRRSTSDLREEGLIDNFAFGYRCLRGQCNGVMDKVLPASYGLRGTALDQLYFMYLT
jgi:hypothetical protein